MAIPQKLASYMAIALICYPLASLAANDPAKLRSAVDKAIRPVMTEYDVSGMAVAITVDGQSFFFNYGMASKEGNISVSESTLFEIGSISKTFTATLASYAQVLGKLSLDDHPGKYMPQLKGSAINKVNLLNLGTYTAGGLPLQFPDEITNEQMVSYFQHWKPEAGPGVTRQYSNTSLGLFGYITGLALQSDFSDAIENQLLPRLGMKNSYIHVPESAMTNYAWGYDKSNAPVRMNPGVLAEETYGIKSTSADMIRFVQLNIEPTQLGTQMQRAVKGTHIGFFKIGSMVQGLGWEQFTYPLTLTQLLSGNSDNMIFESNAVKKLTPPRAPSENILFDKTGSTGGFGAYVAFLPAKKIGIVILANKNYPIPARVKAAYAILEELAPISNLGVNSSAH